MGRKKKTSDLLTAFEIKIMTIIWALRSATVADVRQRLKTESFAYTTISTVMRLLEQKGMLSSVKNGKTHIYVPEINRDEYEVKALDNLIQTLFREDPSYLMQSLMKSSFLRQADLDEMRELLAEPLNKKSFLPTMDL